MYSPYIVMNKTGLPFDLAAKTWSGGQKPVAGSDLFKSKLVSTRNTKDMLDNSKMIIIAMRQRLSVRVQ